MSHTTRRSRPSSAKSASSSSLHLSHVSASVAPYASASAVSHGSTSLLSASPSFAALSTVGNRPRDRDAEQLSAEVVALKETGNDLRQENAFLKTQLQRLVAQLRKKDKQIEQITAMKLSVVSDAGSDAILAGQLRELKSEMTTIAKVTDKCRELEASMAAKDAEIRRLKSVTKFTQIKELEVEAQTYYNEARRMKSAMSLLQQQQAQLQLQLQHAQSQAAGLPRSPPRSLQSGRPSSASPASSSAAAASASARDHELFLSMRHEVASLRAENLRLRADAEGSAAAAVAAKQKQSSLHVLNTLSQLQRQLHEQMQDDADRLQAADAYSDSEDAAGAALAQADQGQRQGHPSYHHDSRHAYASGQQQQQQWQQQQQHGQSADGDDDDYAEDTYDE